MSTITAILEAAADGMLHLPVPAELRRGRVKVVATLEAEQGTVGLGAEAALGVEDPLLALGHDLVDETVHSDGSVNHDQINLRRGKVRVVATLEAELENKSGIAKEKARTPLDALKALRERGGLSHLIPDPVAWQREIRKDRPLPGRD